MTEEERFRKRLDNLIGEAYSGKLVLLPFLDSNKQELAKYSLKHNEPIQPYFYGGYQNSEYNRVIFSSENPRNSDFQITKLKINYSPLNGSIEHRSILGSVLGLGLKREVVGDIVLFKDDYYLMVDTKLKSFIIDNLNYIGRVPVKLEAIDYEIENQNKFMTKTCFLASLRIDVVIAGFYGLSRAKALELIKEGLVKLNHKDCLNPAEMLKENDVLSIRGKGRLILFKIGGKTKSGNLVVDLKKPID